MDHYHCTGRGCYFRIQFVPTCSRCGGTCVPCDGDCETTRSRSHHTRGEVTMPKRWDRVMREAFNAGYRAGIVEGLETDAEVEMVDSTFEPPPGMFDGWYRRWVDEE